MPDPTPSEVEKQEGVERPQHGDLWVRKVDAQIAGVLTVCGTGGQVTVSGIIYPGRGNEGSFAVPLDEFLRTHLLLGVDPDRLASSTPRPPPAGEWRGPVAEVEKQEDVERVGNHGETADDVEWPITISRTGFPIELPLGLFVRVIPASSITQAIEEFEKRGEGAPHKISLTYRAAAAYLRNLTDSKGTGERFQWHCRVCGGDWVLPRHEDGGRPRCPECGGRDRVTDGPFPSDSKGTDG